MSECFVSDRDFERYFEKAAEIIKPTWEGIERRNCADRRGGLHERRWEKSRGRRFQPNRRKVPTAPLKSVSRIG